MTFRAIHILSQLAYGAVFAIADSARSNETLDARAAAITSLLTLGVPEPRALTPPASW
jgi:hypothetical protein